MLEAAPAPSTVVEVLWSAPTPGRLATCSSHTRAPTVNTYCLERAEVAEAARTERRMAGLRPPAPASTSVWLRGAPPLKANTTRPEASTVMGTGFTSWKRPEAYGTGKTSMGAREVTAVGTRRRRPAGGGGVEPCGAGGMAKRG